jgi:3-dehydroquinate dehydratase II
LKILVLNGPNLHMLGKREPEVYGRGSLSDIEASMRSLALELEVEIDFTQSNHEGELVSDITAASGSYDGIIINPAAYTHTSVAMLDAIRAAALPCIEVHLSNTAAREDFRSRSLTAPACIGQIMGFGARSYTLALRALVDHLRQG